VKTIYKTIGRILPTSAADDPVLDDFLDAVDGIACAVDADNRIIAVGRHRWDRFAVESGAPDLCAGNIVGRSLFEFVSGPGLRQAYQKAVDRIASTGEADVVVAHCDRPGMARELRLSITPLRLGGERPGLLFQARIVGGTVRPRLDFSDVKVLLSALGGETDLPIVAMCSFCRLVRRPGSSEAEEWVTAEEYYRLGGTSRVRISHGICADCDAARFPDL
jgi:hypothetical protein